DLRDRRLVEGQRVLSEAFDAEDLDALDPAAQVAGQIDRAAEIAGSEGVDSAAAIDPQRLLEALDDDVVAGAAVEGIRAEAAAAAQHVVAAAADEGVVEFGALEDIVALGAELGDRTGEVAAIDHGRRRVGANDQVGKPVTIDIAGPADALAF